MKVEENEFYLNKSDTHGGSYEIIFIYRDLGEDSFQVMVYNVKMYSWHMNNYYISMLRDATNITNAIAVETVKNMVACLFLFPVKGIKDL